MPRMASDIPLKSKQRAPKYTMGKKEKPSTMSIVSDKRIKAYAKKKKKK